MSALVVLQNLNGLPYLRTCWVHFAPGQNWRSESCQISVRIQKWWFKTDVTPAILSRDFVAQLYFDKFMNLRQNFRHTWASCGPFADVYY